VGFGDVLPFNDEERLFVVVTFYIGTLVFATLISGVLQCVAVCYSMLQCVASAGCGCVMLCILNRETGVCDAHLWCVAVCCSMMQYVAVCCSVLQYVAVCCVDKMRLCDVVM